MSVVDNGSVDVAVIVPTFNRAEFLSECLESILTQSIKPQQIIVVNDGSTDNTLDVLQPYAKHIELFTQENQGVSAARNKALQHVKTKWVAFLDSDDVWLPHRLKLFAEDLDDDVLIFDAHVSDIILTGEGYSESWFGLKKLPLKEKQRKLYENPVELTISGIFPLSIIAKSDKLKKLGGFRQDLVIHEDTCLFSILAMNSSWLFRREAVAKAIRREGDSVALTKLSDKDARFAAQSRCDFLEILYDVSKENAHSPFVKRHFSGALFGLADQIGFKDRKTFLFHLRRAASFHPNKLIGTLKVFLCLTRTYKMLAWYKIFTDGNFKR